MPPFVSLFPFTPHIPCLSTAGFVRAVVPGTQGPPSGSPDVSLLAHSSRGQPAMEGEMQGRRWTSALCSSLQYRLLKWAGCLKLNLQVTSAFPSLIKGIDEPLPLKKRKIVKPGFTHSPWKCAYIRQHRIDTNWRRGDLKSPKVACSFDFLWR